jgi:hypothetical protein
LEQLTRALDDFTFEECRQKDCRHLTEKPGGFAGLQIDSSPR